MNLQPILNNVPGHAEGEITFWGLQMSQNQNALVAIDAVLKTAGPFAQIIEIGTGAGGLSVLFQIYAVQREAQFVTYDVNSCRNRVLAALGADVRQKSCWDAQTEIAAIMQHDGRTLLFCDGGNKIREFNTFAKYLKSGDVVMAHDYAISRELWRSKLRGSMWDWCEITYPDIQAASENLTPIEAYLCSLAAMCAWEKT